MKGELDFIFKGNNNLEVIDELKDEKIGKVEIREHNYSINNKTAYFLLFNNYVEGGKLFWIASLKELHAELITSHPDFSKKYINRKFTVNKKEKKIIRKGFKEECLLSDY